MAGGLRYERGREMPPGMQVLMANRFIEEKMHSAVQDVAVMLEVLKVVDTDCSFCKYAGIMPPCAEESIAFSCVGCQHTCFCKDCHENSKYEWCGAEEALRRLAEMGENYAEK